MTGMGGVILMALCSDASSQPALWTMFAWMGLLAPILWAMRGDILISVSVLA